MTPEQREDFVMKWFVRFVRVGLITLITFYALSFASAYAIQNTVGMGYALGLLIGHTVVLASFMEAPKRAQSQPIEQPVTPHIVYLPTARKALPRSTSGYVYILKHIGGTHYKIGCTSKPDDRLHTFEVKLPFPVAYEVLIKCEDRFTLEKELHKHFASKRVDGEWFSLDEDDLDYLRQLAANE